MRTLSWKGARREVESRVRVRYKETDQMGIAHHSNHLVWFEIGRTDLCRAAGVEYRAIEELGWLMVVTEIGCRYRSPFRYDDEVLIRTSIADAGSRMMKFSYRLCDASGEMTRADGFSQHVWLDRESRRPRAATKELIATFSLFLEDSVARGDA